MLQFVCECDVVKDTGKEEYLRPFIHIELDWIGLDCCKPGVCITTADCTATWRIEIRKKESTQVAGTRESNIV